ncbi:MAG TPA: hypothetical protein VJ417_02510, partial [Candidatus Glassbacteria bacterium]|nr:hypothetical protein [Candidatus Glassbacteria bacterium]
MKIFRYTAALALLAALLYPPGLPAVAPPASGVELPAGFGEFFTRANRSYLAGRHLKKAVKAGPELAGAAPASLSLPVILASFADVPGTLAASQFDNMLFGSYSSGTLKDYYTEVSGGRFALGGKVYGWLKVGLSRAD